MNRAFLLVPAAALTLLTGCGGSGHGAPMGGHAMSGGSSASAGRSTPAGHNAQDVMFAQMMIPHHRQAVTMAEQATTRASSPQVKRLAARIERAQRPEIETMTGWLRAWGARVPASGTMHHGDGMMSEQDMKRLATLSGRAFDQEFLRMMIRHHQGAVAMARTEQARGASADAERLAAAIVTSQSAEIATMRKLLATE